MDAFLTSLDSTDLDSPYTMYDSPPTMAPLPLPSVPIVGGCAPQQPYPPHLLATPFHYAYASAPLERRASDVEQWSSSSDDETDSRRDSAGSIHESDRMSLGAPMMEHQDSRGSMDVPDLVYSTGRPVHYYASPPPAHHDSYAVEHASRPTSSAGTSEHSSPYATPPPAHHATFHHHAHAHPHLAHHVQAHHMSPTPVYIGGQPRYSAPPIYRFDSASSTHSVAYSSSSGMSTPARGTPDPDFCNVNPSLLTSPATLAAADDADVESNSGEYNPRDEYLVRSPRPVRLALAQPALVHSPAATEDEQESVVIRHATKQPRVPAPVPVAGLSKRSRGRRVPTDPRQISWDNLKDGGKGAGRGKVWTCPADGCAKVFKRSEHLKRHIRSLHTNEKPYSCPWPGCGKFFSRHDNLRQHLRVHRVPSSNSAPISADVERQMQEIEQMCH